MGSKKAHKIQSKKIRQIPSAQQQQTPQSNYFSILNIEYFMKNKKTEKNAITFKMNFY
jgi:hypothetical protein